MKFKTIYLHIGSDKAGSTSIQSYFDNNRKEHIEKYNIYYAPGRWQQRLASIFNEHRVKGSGDANSNLTKEEILREDTEYLEEFNNFITKVKPGGSLVLSFEGFHHLSHESIVRAKNFLNAYSNNIKIIYYVRPFFSYAISAMSQTVKMGRLPFTNPPIVEYKNNIERYLKVFSKDELFIRLFKREQLVGNDIVLDFISLIEPEINYRVKEDQVVNKSLSNNGYLIGVEVIKAIKRKEIEIKSYELGALLKPILILINGNAIKLTKGQVDYIIRNTLLDLKFIIDEFGLELYEKKEKYTYLESELDELNKQDYKDLIIFLSSYITQEIILKHNKKYRTISGDDCINKIRDLAVAVENHDRQTSLELMLIAHRLRPNGPFINAKLEEYKLK